MNGTTDLVIRDVSVLDCTGREPSGRHDVMVREGRIAAIEAAGHAKHAQLASVDGSGCTLLPGLTDAHVHFAIIGPHGDHGDEPLINHVLKVATFIEGALDEGFTTVRDAGGLEPAWARAVESGLIRGPRILPSGSYLSQTGGHGDARLAHEAVHRHGTSIPGLIARAEIVDGPDAVRRAAREQLRRGATQIKIFASGGVVSPTDPFDSVQLSREEIAAAVEVARGWHTYVLAHCHTSESIEVAVAAGVRSIEHGSLLEPETAARMAEHGVFMVPTLQTVIMIRDDPDRFGLTAEKAAAIRSVAERCFESIRVADAAGVAIGSGSDVVGPWQGRRGEEIILKAPILGVHRAIISATRTNAELFNLADRIGTVEVGKDADLILLRGEPLDEVELFGDPANVRVVLRRGAVAKDADDRLTSAG
jgi:imidazolonepropionase-like amidohydrolase